MNVATFCKALCQLLRLELVQLKKAFVKGSSCIDLHPAAHKFTILTVTSVLYARESLRHCDRVYGD